MNEESRQSEANKWTSVIPVLSSSRSSVLLSFTPVSLYTRPAGLATRETEDTTNERREWGVWTARGVAWETWKQRLGPLRFPSHLSSWTGPLFSCLSPPVHRLSGLVVTSSHRPLLTHRAAGRAKVEREGTNRVSDVSRTARPPDPRGLRRFATHRRNRPHSSLRSSCRLRRDGCEERVIAAEHPSQRPKTRPTFLRLVSRPFPTVTFLLTSSQSVNRVFSIHISFPSTHLTFGSDREWNETWMKRGEHKIVMFFHSSLPFAVGTTGPREERERRKTDRTDGVAIRHAKERRKAGRMTVRSRYACRSLSFLLTFGPPALSLLAHRLRPSPLRSLRSLRSDVRRTWVKDERTADTRRGRRDRRERERQDITVLYVSKGYPLPSPFTCAN